MDDIMLALELTLYGLLTVFGVLLLFYLVISVITRVFPDKKETPPPKLIQSESPKPEQIELIGLDEPTAAMIIAIVSEKTGTPPGQLSIISIKKL